MVGVHTDLLKRTVFFARFALTSITLPCFRFLQSGSVVEVATTTTTIDLALGLDKMTQKRK